jgi:hypothetical protein
VTATGAKQKPGGVEVVFGLTFAVDGENSPACIADVVVLYR